MFWGLKLEAEKQYSQLVEKPFHISQATLGPLTHEDKTGGPIFPQHIIEVHVVVEKTDYIICYLDGSKRILQQPLDLRISEGEEIVLYCRGHHTAPHDTVYLTGYFIEEVGYPLALEDLANEEYSVSDFTEEEEEDSGHEDLTALLFQDLSSGGSSDEEYVASSHLALPPAIDKLPEEGSGESEVGGTARPVGSKGLKEKSIRKRKREEGVGTPEGKQTAEADSSSKKKQRKLLESKVVRKESTSGEEKQPKVNKSKAKSETSGSAPKKGKTKPVKLPGGTEILDMTIGEGKLAKPGKKVFVRYTGRLAHNNKIFDSNVGPDHSPFFFRLGQGEVIRGWDEGVAGMRVGGKRKLIIPPKQGYGAAGAPPTIPPHSKLIFDVELISLK